MSVFASYKKRSYPFQFKGRIHINNIAGGVPSDPRVVEGWLRTKIADDDDLIRRAAAEIMAERGVSADEAMDEVAKNKNLCGFKRDGKGLYIPGYHLKACLKEAGNIAIAVGKLNDRWGNTRKGLKSFLAEHVIVEDDRIYLGVNEPSGIVQSFPKSFRGSSIQYNEYCEDVEAEFTVLSDYDFKEEEWAHLWLTAEENGLGACRSQGFGTFEVIEWEPMTAAKPKRKLKSA